MFDSGDCLLRGAPPRGCSRHSGVSYGPPLMGLVLGVAVVSETRCYEGVTEMVGPEGETGSALRRLDE